MNTRPQLRLDLSPRSRVRVVVFTVLGTLFCIAAAFAIDSFSFSEGWRWGEDPVNNLLIPLVLAPPAFYLLLSKLRQLAEAHHELLIVSATDSLTSVYNRRAFTALVDGWLERMEAEGGLLVIDVDHFKAVNDSFGHDRGDEALKLVAGAIRSSVSESAVVGRLGGEEFGVFLPVRGAEALLKPAERIRLAVRAVAFVPDGRNHSLSVSVGVARFQGRTSFGELYRRADQQLYAAKRNGRNRVEIDGPAPPIAASG